MREARFVKSLTVGVTVDVYRAIKKITDDEKISMTRWVRKAINKALEGDAVEEE
jgi:predicted HicB family RNase H-like nuclease